MQWNLLRNTTLLLFKKKIQVFPKKRNYQLLIAIVLGITIKFRTSMNKLMQCCLPLEFKQNSYKIDSCSFLTAVNHALRLLLTEAELMKCNKNNKIWVIFLKTYEITKEGHSTTNTKFARYWMLLNDNWLATVWLTGCLLDWFFGTLCWLCL